MFFPLIPVRHLIIKQPILRNLREKAFQVYSQFRSGNSNPALSLSVGKSDYGDDELALFGGLTRVSVSKLLKTGGGKGPASSVDRPPSSPHDNDPKTSTNSPDIHPSLLEYLSTVPIDSDHPQSSVESSVHSPDFPPMDSLPHIASEWHDIQQPLGQPVPSMSQESFIPPILPQNAAYAFKPEFSDYGMEEDSQEPPVDLGMMMIGDSGMDEQWISFMKASGLLKWNPDDSGSGF